MDHLAEDRSARAGGWVRSWARVLLATAVVRDHEPLPLTVAAEHLRGQDAVVGAEHLDRVAVSARLAVAAEARALALEGEKLLRAVERSAIVDPEVRHHRSDPGAHVATFFGIVAERHQAGSCAGARHVPAPFEQHPAAAERTHGLDSANGLGGLIGGR